MGLSLFSERQWSFLHFFKFVTSRDGTPLVRFGGDPSKIDQHGAKSGFTNFGTFVQSVPCWPKIGCNSPRYFRPLCLRVTFESLYTDSDHH